MSADSRAGTAHEPAEEWANTTRLGPYDADAIRRLKDEREGTIYVSGSGQLVRGPDGRRACRHELGRPCCRALRPS